MIDRLLLAQTVERAISGTDIFLVDLKVDKNNSITVEIDSPEGIDIDTCAKITRAIEADFDRDVEDYDLEVGSAGLTSPFKVKGQYLKNIGNPIEVLTQDGKKLKGTLLEVSDDSFVLGIKRKVKEEGKKRPVEIEEPLLIKMDDTKYVKYLIEFK